MRKLKEYFTLFFILFSLWAGAQSVTIMGIASAYKGRDIAAYSYKDLITYAPIKVGTAQVDDSGHFSIEVPGIKASQYLYLGINNQQGSIYVSPGQTYHVIFPAPDSSQYENDYTTHIIDLGFIITDSDNINNLIIDFNDQFDIFWRQCYAYFVKKQGPSHLDSFYVAMQHRYANVNNPYFKGYMQYTIAEIGINILEGAKALGDKYLKNKPVLYNNYEYMKFVNDYFSDYLEENGFKGAGADILGYIQSGNYKGILDVLRINPMLNGNDSLCTLVLLKGLYDLYYTGNYSKDNIKTMLYNFAAVSPIQENKIIANDMLNSFSDVTNGFASPEFGLKDAQGNVTSILDFRGKYLYLCFYKSNSDACLRELTVLSSIYKKYSKKMGFVCISEDKNIDEMKRFLQANTMFNWTFLYDEGGKVLAKYEIKSLPQFFLINPQGKFYLSPADSPSHGIELTFDRLLNHKKTNNQ